MRFVFLSFFFFLFLSILACSPSGNIPPVNDPGVGTSVTVTLDAPQNDAGKQSGSGIFSIDGISWSSIASATTVEFATVYHDFLQLPVENREGYRRLAENEMGRYYQLKKEMAKYEDLRLNPQMYGGIGAIEFSMSGVGFNIVLHDLDLATAMDPSYVEAWSARGELALIAGALHNARQSLEAALLVVEHMEASGAIFPVEEKLEIHRHLGWALRNLGYHEEGLVHVNRALAIRPRDHELLLVKGLLLAGAGHTTAAIKLAVKLPAEKYPDLSNQKSGLEMTSSGYASLWIKSQALFAIGDNEGAMHLLGDSSLYQRALPYASQYWNDVGLVAEMAHNENAAVIYGIVYASQEQGVFCPVMALPSGTQILGYPDRELPVLTTFGPQFYVGGSLLGYISFHMNMMVGGVFPQQRERSIKSALDALDIAERRHIKPVLCQALRGRIYHLQERYQEAEIELKSARAELAAGGEVDDRTSYLLGLIALDDDRNAEAQGLLEEAVQNSDGVGLYYRSLGLALAKQGKIREAEVVLDKALGIDAYSVPGLYNLGMIYCKMKRFEDAVGVLEKAYNLDRENREVQHLLQLAASSSREQGKSLQSSIPGKQQDYAESSHAYVTLVMKELDTLFTVIDSTSNQSGENLNSLKARKMYEENPTTFNRKVLALALMDEGKIAEVQALLGPFWGNDLGPDEVVILLYADKVEGEQLRAQTLARAMLQGETGTDNPFIRVLALASLSGREAVMGEYALGQLAVSPVTGVNTSSGSDPNGYWSEYMRVGFQNYRAAVHAGFRSVDYVDILPDPWLENAARKMDSQGNK